VHFGRAGVLEYRLERLHEIPNLAAAKADERFAGAAFPTIHLL
jgi:hypothetical protein